MAANQVFDSSYIGVATKQYEAAVTAAEAQRSWDIALAIANALLMTTAAGYQSSLADWQMDLAEEAQAHWEKFLPFEADLVNDTFNIPKYQQVYDTLCEQYGDIMQDSFYANHDDFLDWLDSTCQTLSECEDARWKNALSLAEADAMSYAARVNEQRERIWNDIRYSMRAAVLALGSGVLQQAVAFSQLAASNSNGLPILGGLLRLGIHSATFEPPRAVAYSPPYFVATAQYGVGPAPTRSNNPEPVFAPKEADELPVMSGKISLPANSGDELPAKSGDM